MPQYEVLRNGTCIGRYERDELLDMAQFGLLLPTDIVRDSRTGRLVAAKKLATKTPIASQRHAPYQTSRNANGQTEQPNTSEKASGLSVATYVLRVLGVLTLSVGILQKTLPPESAIHFYFASPYLPLGGYAASWFKYAGLAGIGIGLFLLRTGIVRGKAWAIDVLTGAVAISYLTATCLSYIAAAGYQMVPSADPYLNAAKRAVTEFCDRTVDELTESFVKTPEWHMDVDSDGTHHVTVTGKILFNDADADLALRFNVSREGARLETTSVNGVELPTPLARRLWFRMCDTP